MPYYLMFAALLTLAALGKLPETRQFSGVWLISSTILLISFAGLRRAGVGFDDVSYIKVFTTIPPITEWLSGEYVYSWDSAGMEPLYIALGSTIRALTENYTWLFLIIATISVSATVYNYRQYSPIPGLSVLVYFCHTFLYRDMNQIRAGIVAALGLFLIRLISERRHYTIVITIMTASLIHMGALAYFITYAASYIKLSRRQIIAVTAISIACGAIGFSGILVQVLPDLGPLTDKVKRYYESQHAEPLGIMDITNLKNLALLLGTLVLTSSVRQVTKHFDVQVTFLFLATAWRFLFNDFGILAARISTFFGIVEPILVVSLALSIPSRIAGIAFVILYSVTMLTLNLLRGFNEYGLTI